MKKILVILACVAMLFSFASCNDSNGAASATLGDSYVAAKVVGNFFGSSATATTITALEGATGEATATSLSVTLEGATALAAATTDLTDYTVSEASKVTVNFYKDAATTTDSKTAITSADINGSITVLSPEFKDYTVAINGSLDVEGTLTVTNAGTEQAPKYTAELDITSLYLPEGISIIVNNNNADKTTVFKDGGIITAEAAQAAEEAAKAAAKEAAQKYVDAIEAGIKAVKSFTGSGKTVTVTTDTLAAVNNKTVTLTLATTADTITGTSFNIDATKSSISAEIEVDTGVNLDLSKATYEFTPTELTLGTAADISSVEVPEGGLVVAISGKVTLGGIEVTL